jgi:hypothetical protein
MIYLFNAPEDPPSTIIIYKYSKKLDFLVWSNLQNIS